MLPGLGLVLRSLFIVPITKPFYTVHSFQNCQSDGRRWQRILTSEREIRQRLEDMVEQLAKQHSHLEQMVRNAQAQQKEIEHQNNRHQVTRLQQNKGTKGCEKAVLLYSASAASQKIRC